MTGTAGGDPLLETGPLPDDVKLGDIRRELRRLVLMSEAASLPKPTRINGPDHAWPGHEWDLREMERPYGTRDRDWVIRTLDEQNTADGLVYIAVPDPLYPDPDPDFVALYASDAIRIARALFAAAQRSMDLAAGVSRLQSHQDS